MKLLVSHRKPCRKPADTRKIHGNRRSRILIIIVIIIKPAHQQLYKGSKQETTTSGMLNNENVTQKTTQNSKCD